MKELEKRRKEHKQIVTKFIGEMKKCTKFRDPKSPEFKKCTQDIVRKGQIADKQYSDVGSLWTDEMRDNLQRMIDHTAKVDFSQFKL